MSNLSRIPAITAAMTLAFAGHAGAAELQQAPEAVTSDSITIQSQPELDSAVQEDDAGTAGTAPTKLEPQIQPQLKGSGASAPGSAPKPTLRSEPRLKSTPELQQAPKAIGTSPTQGSGIGSGPELEPRMGRGCPDPAIVDLRPGWPVRNDDGTYSFKLLAIIENVGDAHYRSDNSQQSLTLREGSRELTTESWPDRTLHPDYAPGEGGSIVQAVSNWNPSSEFVDDFTARLNYDPDITMDGNPENDDCRGTNNTARLGVAELRRILSSL